MPQLVEPGTRRLPRMGAMMAALGTRCLFVIAVAGIVVSFGLFVDLGGTIRGGSHVTAGGLLEGVLVWCWPMAIYLVGVISMRGSVRSGIVLIIANAAALVVTFRDTHSTAGVALLVFPVLLAMVTIGLVIADSAARGVVGTWRTETPGRPGADLPQNWDEIPFLAERTDESGNP